MGREVSRKLKQSIHWFFWVLSAYLALYFFLCVCVAVLDLCCCTWALSSCTEQKLLFVGGAGYSLRWLRGDAQALGLQTSVMVAYRLSGSAAGGVFLDQGSDLCPLHWQADSSPLGHQGSLLLALIWNNGAEQNSFWWEVQKAKPVVFFFQLFNIVRRVKFQQH